MADLLRADGAPPAELHHVHPPDHAHAIRPGDPPGASNVHRGTARSVERAVLTGVDALALTLALIFGLGTAAGAIGAVIVCVLGAMCGLGFLGLHRPRLRLSALDDAPRLLAGSGLGAALALAFRWALDPASGQARQLAPAIVAAAAGTLAGRALCYSGLRAARRLRHGDPALIVGTGLVAGRLASALLADRQYGLTPIGQVDSGPRFDDTPLTTLGDVTELPRLLGELYPTHVLVAFSEQREADLVDVLRACRGTTAQIWCVPRLFEVHPSTHLAEDIASIPMVRLCRADRRPVAFAVKRGFDIVVSGVALVLLAPVMLVCAALVRMEGGPGVLFRQVRVGQDGRHFTLLKFRSLRPVNEQESATLWSVAHDSRLGPVGRLLRSTSMDELPQLINILRGQMSLVGPRPERPHFVAEFARRHARYAHRHRGSVGLTGWAQVNGLRGDTSISDRVALDNWYIENWSLWLDAKILLRTAGAVVRELGGISALAGLLRRKRVH